MILKFFDSTGRVVSALFFLGCAFIIFPGWIWVLLLGIGLCLVGEFIGKAIRDEIILKWNKTETSVISLNNGGIVHRSPANKMSMYAIATITGIVTAIAGFLTENFFIILAVWAIFGGILTGLKDDDVKT
jgi:hypothetical protein